MNVHNQKRSTKDSKTHEFNQLKKHRNIAHIDEFADKKMGISQSINQVTEDGE